jgi:hypothetical protein
MAHDTIRLLYSWKDTTGLTLTANYNQAVPKGEVTVQKDDFDDLTTENH